MRAKKSKSKSSTNSSRGKRTPARRLAKKPTEKAGPQAAMAWELRLYVAGNTPNSIAAFSNLQQICETHLGGRYRIEIIDLLRNPQLAGGDQIIAIPTLVRRLPTPIKKIIGDLSNTERVLIGLDLKPAPMPLR